MVLLTAVAVMVVMMRLLATVTVIVRRLGVVVVVILLTAVAVMVVMMRLLATIVGVLVGHPGFSFGRLRRSGLNRRIIVNDYQSCRLILM